MTERDDPFPTAPDLAELVRRVPLRQPDRLSCGAASLVVAQAVLDPAYAALVAAGGADGWREEVLALHRRVTSALDTRGALQLPWPRPLGTPPWAVARRLSALTGPGRPATPYATRPVLDRGSAWAALVAASAERPVALYVGDRWLPRHVVLVVPSGAEGVLTCFEPSRGELRRVDRGAFVDARLGLAGWDTPWFVVAPRRPGAVRRRARRTPA